MTRLLVTALAIGAIAAGFGYAYLSLRSDIDALRADRDELRFLLDEQEERVSRAERQQRITTSHLTVINERVVALEEWQPKVREAFDIVTSVLSNRPTTVFVESDPLGGLASNNQNCLDALAKEAANDEYGYPNGSQLSAIRQYC